MSFMLTTHQVRIRLKDVTRRLGWWNLKPGEVVCAVEKCQGLKKGEKINRLCVIRIKSTRGEELRNITYADCVREGFPEMQPWEFVAMFAKHNKCTPYTEVNRIEFEYVDAVQ